MRLAGGDPQRQWDGRGHFFAAAAEAMRRILIERARRGRRLRHGGGLARVDLDRVDSLQLQPDPAHAEEHAQQLLALDDALTRLEAEEPAAAALVKLRYFAGMTTHEAATALGISARTANRHWAYAKAWLYQQMGGSGSDDR
jgi:RNA polymerase sigma factor (TIGR02999 family)